jgi:hypothetical protein
MEWFWGGVVGATLAILGQRLLFTGPETVHSIKRSLRFFRQQYWGWRGRRVLHCPKCFHPEPDSVVDATVLPDGWEDAPEGTVWLRCPECQHMWGVRSVITKFMPLPTSEQATSRSSASKGSDSLPRRITS